LWQSSPSLGSQIPSPQLGQAPQSGAQFWQFSRIPQTPSPHAWAHGPQSTEQLAQSSVEVSQVWLPQVAVGQVPQSTSQIVQLSNPSQMPSPQGHGPQSAAQVSQASCH
jgi:hypothetical protein